jgi:uncharacterized protein
MIDVRDNPAESRFETSVDGITAFAEYRLDGDRITFTHTIVPKALEGRGIGSALVRAALGAARERGLKVVPRCSFVAAWMRRHPETQDLLDPGAAF